MTRGKAGLMLVSFSSKKGHRSMSIAPNSCFVSRLISVEHGGKSGCLKMTWETGVLRWDKSNPLSLSAPHHPMSVWG